MSPGQLFKAGSTKVFLPSGIQSAHPKASYTLLKFICELKIIAGGGGVDVCA